MFTDYTFTIISTISELNEIADALNNRRIQWDRLESKLMICNRETCNCFSNEEMGFSLETKYDGVIEEVENLSRLFPTAKSGPSAAAADSDTSPFWMERMSLSLTA